jgi:hypothetical protein
MPVGHDTSPRGRTGWIARVTLDLQGDPVKSMVDPSTVDPLGVDPRPGLRGACRSSVRVKTITCIGRMSHDVRAASNTPRAPEVELLLDDRLTDLV